jgi:tryptophan-rich sensory protein
MSEKRARVKLNKNSIRNPRMLIYCILAVAATAVIGMIFTDTTGWYQEVKPAITPPNIVFPIVWTILFALLALSMYFSISNANKKDQKILINLFAINLILNVLWSVLFFGMHNPLASFVELGLLLLSILALIRTTWKISPLSSWLLLPYAIWVSFAGFLNYVIVFYSFF